MVKPKVNVSYMSITFYLHTLLCGIEITRAENVEERCKIIHGAQNGKCSL